MTSLQTFSAETENAVPGTAAAPETHRIDVAMTADGTVKLEPPESPEVRPGDSIVWVFSGEIEQNEMPHVVFIDGSGPIRAPFEELVTTGHQVEAHRALPELGDFACRYGVLKAFLKPDGQAGILPLSAAGDFYGVRVLPPPN